MALAALATLDTQLPGGLIDGSASTTEARTAAFNVVVLSSLFNCLNSRSERDSAFRAPLGNPLLWWAIAASVSLQVAVVHLPVLNRGFTTAPLSAADWVLCVAMASAVLWVDELRKLWLRRSRRPAPPGWPGRRAGPLHPQPEVAQATMGVGSGAPGEGRSHAPRACFRRPRRRVWRRQ